MTWWKEGSVYDDSYKVSDNKANTVRNTMRYTNWRREDLGTKFTSQA